METDTITISVKGRILSVPSVKAGGRTIIASPGWLKIASIKDADWLEGPETSDPECCIEKIRRDNFRADLFTFAQTLPDIKPRYSYPMEWDNVAAISTDDYSCWWEHKLPQETRKNVRRAGKRGVVIREVDFSDHLLHSIVEINNETPIRQGRPFWHYGKSFLAVKKDYATFLDRSHFIGAYFEDSLIGFIKMVYRGDIASVLQMLCMNKHYDKRPANALTAKAVEICHARGLKNLTYGKYLYGNNSKSPLTEFKRRNGYEQFLVPRYYIPLTAAGRTALYLNLNHGLKQLLPPELRNFATRLRSRWYGKKVVAGSSQTAAQE